MIVGEAFIKVSPEAGNFAADAEREVRTGMGPVAKTAAGIMAAAFVVKGGFNLFSGLVADAEEARQVMQQTEAVLKSTGGIANVTAEGVDRLSESLSIKTGVDDEVIASGQNLLLTFTKVRNEFGKGNDVFDRATALGLDMAKALGTDAKGAALQLGKALNDPVTGITALRRAGVSFTDQQRDQIKTMVEAGDLLGAQKLILSELEVQFGGSAEAVAKGTDRMRVAWGNFREDLGTLLLPVVDKVSNALADKIPVAADAVIGALSNLGPAVGGAVDTLQSVFGPLVELVGESLGAAFADMQDDLRAIGDVVDTVDVGALLDGISGAWDRLRSSLGTALQAAGLDGVAANVGGLSGTMDGLATFARDHAGDIAGFFIPGALAVDALRLALTSDPSLLSMFDTSAEAAGRLTTKLQEQNDVVVPLAAGVASFVAAFATYSQINRTVSSVSTAFSLLGPAISSSLAPLLANPAGLIIAGIVALGVAVTAAYFKIEPFREAVDSVARTVRDVAVSAFDVATKVVGQLGQVFGRVGAVIGEAFAGVGGAVNNALGPIQQALGPLGRFLRDDVGATFAAGAEFIVAALQRMADLIAIVIGPTVAVLKVLGGVVQDVLVAAFKVAGPIVEAVLANIGAALSAAAKVGLPVFTLAVKTLGAVVRVTFDAISQTVQSVLGVIRGIFQVFTGLLTGDWGKLWTGLQTIVTAPLQAIVSFITSTFGTVTSYFSQLPELLGNVLGGLWDGFTTITTTAFSGLGSIISGALDGAIELLSGLPGRIIELGAALLSAVPSWLGEFVTAAATEAADLIVDVVTELGSLPGKVTGLAADLLGAVSGWLVGAITGGYNAMSGYFTGTVLPFFTGLPGEFVGAVGDGLEVLKSWGTAVIEGLWNGAKDMWNFVRSWVEDTDERIIEAIGDALGMLKSIGSDIVQGMWNGIKAQWDKMTGWIADAADKLPGPIKKIFGIGSPSKVFMEIGGWLIEGMDLGVQQQWDVMSANMAQRAAFMGKDLATTLETNLAPAVKVVKDATGAMTLDVEKLYSGFLGAVITKALEPAIGAAATRLLGTTLVEQAAQHLQVAAESALAQMVALDPIGDILGVVSFVNDKNKTVGQQMADRYVAAMMSTLDKAIAPAIDTAATRLQVTTLVEQVAQALERNVTAAIQQAITTAGGGLPGAAGGAGRTSGDTGPTNAYDVKIYDARVKDLDARELALWLRRTSNDDPRSFVP